MLDFVLHTTKAVSVAAWSAWDKKLIPAVVYCLLKCDKSQSAVFPPFPCSGQFLLCYCSFRSCCNRVGEQFPATVRKHVKLLFSPGPLCLLPLWSLPPLRAWFPLFSGLLQEPLHFCFVCGVIRLRKQLLRFRAIWALMPANSPVCQMTKIVGSVISRGSWVQKWHCNVYDTVLFSKRLDCALVNKLCHGIEASSWY